jgi:hypothetical protein
MMLTAAALLAAASAASAQSSAPDLPSLDAVLGQIKALASQAPSVGVQAEPRQGGFAERLSPRQKLTIEQITSVFETGEPQFQYGDIEDNDDRAGVTCGRAGFTGGELEIIVSRYSSAKGGDTALAAYLPCLEKMGLKIEQDYSCLFPSLTPAQMATPGFKSEDGGLISKVDFGKAWTEAAKDPAMRQVQDRYEEETYFGPSMVEADALGLTTALGAACVYDAEIQMDTRPLFAAIRTGFAAVHGGREKPANLAEETDWIRLYLKERRAELAPRPDGMDTRGRVDSLAQILDSGNLQLGLPLNFTYDGQSASIKAD